MSQQGANVGLTYDWDLGESGWKQQMDENLLVIDALLMPNMISSTTAEPPASNSSGDRYLVPASGAGGAWAGYEDHITIYDGENWLLLPPKNGWRVYVIDTGEDQLYSNSSWAVLT